MAITFTTGFDWIPQAAGTSVVQADFSGRGMDLVISGSSPRSATGRITGKALRFTDWAASVTYVSGVSYASGAMGVAALQDTTAGRFIRLIDLDGVPLTIGRLDANNVTVSYNPAGTANDITQTINVPSGTSVFNYYEIRWTPSLIEVALNGAVVYTKVQTSQRPFASMSTYGESFNVGPTVDDVYVADDATFRGDCYVRSLTLTDTAENTGTVTGAANAHTALASFDSDTAYVAYSADAQKTLCGLSDLVDSPSTIYAVTLSRQARKTDTGTVTESLLLKTASEQVIGPAFSGFSTSYAGRRFTLNTDPHDGSSWSKAKIDSMQAGLKRGV